MSAVYVLLGYTGFVTMIFLLYSMAYLSVCKDFERMSMFCLAGMIVTFLLSLILRFWLHWSVSYSMLFSLVVGFLLIGSLEFMAFRRYFPENSGHYRLVFTYCRKWWKLMAANFFYMLGLYVHNFVFWTHETAEIVVKSFIWNQNYDMASTIAMFTNISTMVIFVSNVEMNFNRKYKSYSEMVIGGKWGDIDASASRMFRQLSEELVNLVRLQFTITVVAYLFCIVILPQFGFAGSIMRIYPCLAAGFFMLFIMYATMHLLYYYNDFIGAVFTSGSFCIVTFLVSLVALDLPEIWYGVGVVFGAFTGWTVGYFRLRWVERHLNTNMFCTGTIVRREKARRPDSKVYDKRDGAVTETE